MFPNLLITLGLIDEGEDAETAAIRELKEETGFLASHVIESSPVIWSDPGKSGSLPRSEIPI